MGAGLALTVLGFANGIACADDTVTPTTPDPGAVTMPSAGSKYYNTGCGCAHNPHARHHNTATERNVTALDIGGCRYIPWPTRKRSGNGDSQRRNTGLIIIVRRYALEFMRAMVIEFES
jgi:hypothetical protein